MITMFFKFTLSFVISYIILTIPFSGRSLFYHINKMTGPIGISVSKSIKKNISKSVIKTQKIGKQLFINSNPPDDPEIHDQIKRKQAAIAKKRKSIFSSRRKERLLQEELTHKEVEQLDKLIESER
jgi:hypothetical protein